MASIKIPRKLTEKEQAHVDSGGRIFALDPQNRILIISKDDVIWLPTQPKDAAGEPTGYSDRQDGIEKMELLAFFAQDTPMVVDMRDSET